MDSEKKRQATKQIVQLLSVIFAALFAAALALGAMLYSWNPTGTYLAKNVLISPEVAGQISFSQYSQQTGGKNRIVFDHVEFTYFDNEMRQFRNIEVDQEKYSKFYKLIESDRSLSSVDETIEQSFSQNSPSTMTVAVRNKGGGEAVPFQEVYFVEDYYRVELHEDTLAGHYAYFYHPQIGQKTMKMFKDE